MPSSCDSERLPLMALEQISIAVPCTVEWESMSGNQQQRHCSQCQQQVFNLSAMSRTAAEEFLQAHSVVIAEGSGTDEQKLAQRLCVRLYRRPDGTVVTRDCSRIAQATRKTAAWIFGLAAGLLFLMLGLFGWSRVSTGSVHNPFDAWPRLCEHEPFRTLFGSKTPPVIMGDIAPIIPTNPAPTTGTALAQNGAAAE